MPFTDWSSWNNRNGMCCCSKQPVRGEKTSDPRTGCVGDYTICESIRVTISWSFSDLLRDKWYLQIKYICRQHETLDCRKFHNLLSNSCHRSGKGHMWQLNGILLWSFWPGVGIYFLIDIWGWVIKFLTFLMVGSAKFLPRKTFLFGATPRHK